MNTNTIFEVLSNIRHNGDDLIKGSVFEADLADFQHLVTSGALRIVEGARDLAHAAEIVAANEVARLEASEEAPAEGPDTWGPTKEPVVNEPVDLSGVAVDIVAPAPETTSTEPVLARFTVLKDFEVTNTESKNFGKHTIGSVIEADPAAAQPLVDDGTLALETAPTGDNL